MQAVLIAGLSALVLVACAPPAGMQASTTPAPPDMHNSRNALDWAGTYEGVLPCADCPGIQTRVMLMADGQFELSTRYIDRQTTPTTTRGRFAWNAAGSDITLGADSAAPRFRVGEGRLLQLDRDGTAPRWNAPGRVLTLQPKK
jgi:uncharacterized lipoprotein NlpE involved in copper resistance